MYKKMQLKNGMKVLFVESHKSPVVSIQMWVRTGSADEQKGEEGISHFIEHLVFKGTDKFGLGEIAQVIEGSGGELNAYTSFDQTVFYVTISKEFFETGMDVISQMMGHATFDKTEIDNEREVVIEEIKRGKDSPSRDASQLLFSTLYKKHPYGKPVIGYEKVVNTVSRKTLINYFHKRYVPENMVLIVAGDIKKQEAASYVKKYFDAFKPYKLKKVKRVKEPIQIKAVTKVKKTQFNENTCYLSWRVPPATHADIPALDVLSLILGQGASSRLVKRLRVDTSLVNHVSVSAYTPSDPGFFTVAFTAQEENIKEVLEIINEELFLVLTKKVSRSELEKAIVNFESDEFYSLETVDGLARKVGTCSQLYNDHTYFKKYIKQIQNLTDEDILKAAKKYITWKKLTATLSTPGDKPLWDKLLRKWSSDFKKMKERSKKIKQDKAPAKKIKKIKWAVKSSGLEGPHVEHIKLDSGANLYLCPNSEVPIVSLKSAFLGGLRAEEKSHHGISELLSRAWTSGTQSMSEEQLYALIDAKASSVSAFGGRNTLGLSMTSLTPFSEEILDVYFDVLVNPAFTELSIQRECSMMLDQIKRRDDNPAQICVLQFMRQMFGNHPYSIDPFGEEKTLKNISRADILKFKDKLVTSKNQTLVLSGSFNRDLWIEKLSTKTKNLQPGRAWESTFGFSPPEQPTREKSVLKKEQAHVILGYPGLVFGDKNRHVLSLIQSVLAGQGGRLFIELRDKQSLAYSVSPLKMEGIDAGYFGAYIGCSPEKVDKALGMMRIEFEKLMNKAVGSDELESAKRYLIGRHDIGLQRVSSIASNVLFDAIYGVPPEETFNFAQQVNQVTAADIQRLSQELFSKPETVSIVGP